MISSRSCGIRASARERTAAVCTAVIAAGYSLLSVFYFYEDFFKYVREGAAMAADRTGLVVSVDGYYLWTILSPWRMAGAALAVALLGVSAAALWHNRPRARALTMLSIWGVLFPQVLWYTEFVVDWHGGQGLADVIMLAVLVAAVPTVLLAQSGRALADWDAARPDRLLGLAIACSWIGFAATEFLDHSYQLMSWTAYLGALAALPLAVLAVKGIYSLRSWGLWAGVAAAVSLALVPLAASWASYMHTGGYIDRFHDAAAGSDCRVALSMLVPVAAVWILASPYLHAFLRKLRSR